MLAAQVICQQCQPISSAGKLAVPNVLDRGHVPEELADVSSALVLASPVLLGVAPVVRFGKQDPAAGSRHLQ